MSADTDLDRLAAHAGIVDAFHGYDGVERRTGPDTKRALLATMGYQAETERQAADSLRAVQSEERDRPAPREIILRAGDPVSIPVSGPLTWHLRPEHDRRSCLDGKTDETIELPPLPTGLHILEVKRHDKTTRTVLIVAPRRAPSVTEVTGTARLWGATCALYGLSSDRNIGLGDYHDLADASTAFAAHGADFLGINPVHALGTGDGTPVSPYSPNHRAFYNTAHIAIDAIPQFADCTAVRRFLEDNAPLLDSLRSTKHIDYEAVAPIHDTLLKLLFSAFEESAARAVDGAAFEEFIAEQGEPLRRFAIFEAISEQHGADWRIWPEPLRSPQTPAVTIFQQQHGRSVRFHAWKQWLASQQLGSAQTAARTAGMRLGLYLDLAVGARPGSAEVWATPDAFASAVSLGTPPDAFSPNGQDWALSPFSPAGLRNAGYAPLLGMLRATMRHAGLIRIDHFIGFERSFWLPASGEPGAYVRYPIDTLLAIVALEARRTGTVVVGEDLGLIPQRFRDRLAASGIYGCAVMQFERTSNGAYRDPSSYNSQTLASAATHDTPTVLGFSAANDITWWKRLGRLANNDARIARRDRAKAAAALAQSCIMTNTITEPAPPALELTVELAHGALARAGSDLVAVQLDDILEATEQQNLPGTIAEHPYWRWPTTVPVEQLADEPRMARTGKLMTAAGRRSEG